MKQHTLAVVVGFERFGRQSRRAEFLSQMDVVVPWPELVALIDPHYPDTGKGRPPVGVERMLRIYFLQQWFDLSDPATPECQYSALFPKENEMLCHISESPCMHDMDLIDAA